MAINFTLNESSVSLNVAADKPLLWALREDANLVGTKFGCGIALCGACTVHVDGQPTRSCVTPCAAIAGKNVTTIEGISAKGLNAVQQAWIEMQVPQCGYCQSGFVMAVTALLEKNAAPSDVEVDEAITNLCRCGTYPAMRKAIRRAIDLKKGAK
jgi:isoquinoline 1-oxidoreductase subunit alpha